MKQFIKKYITICIAVFIMLTSSINADAYELGAMMLLRKTVI